METNKIFYSIFVSFSDISQTDTHIDYIQLEDALFY